MAGHILMQIVSDKEKQGRVATGLLDELGEQNLSGVVRRMGALPGQVTAELAEEKT